MAATASFTMDSTLAVVFALFMLGMSFQVHAAALTTGVQTDLPRIQLAKSAPGSSRAASWLGQPYLGGVKEAINELALGSHPDYVALNNYLDAQVVAASSKSFIDTISLIHVPSICNKA